MRLWTGLLLFPLLISCQPEPASDAILREKLPTEFDVKIGRFGEGAFRLAWKAKKAGSDWHEFMRTDQCRNVTLIQDWRAIEVFYENLTLHSFGDWPGGPAIHLCDLSDDRCGRRLNDYLQAGRDAKFICEQSRN